MYTQELLKHGWLKASECQCSGALEEIFRSNSKPDFTIHIFPTRNKFEVYGKINKIHTASLEKLNEYLINYK